MTDDKKLQKIWAALRAAQDHVSHALTCDNAEEVRLHLDKMQEQLSAFKAEHEAQPPTSTVASAELLVLSHRGIRIGVLGHYGVYDDCVTFSDAVKAAQDKLAAGHARAFVAIRIKAATINGFGDGTDRELARFEVYPDRVALVPTGQGGLSDEQKASALALPMRRLQ